MATQLLQLMCFCLHCAQLNHKPLNGVVVDFGKRGHGIFEFSLNGRLEPPNKLQYLAVFRLGCYYLLLQSQDFISGRRLKFS
mmetsp:Transcript_11489/g.27278  ORF Transcript_11489/g.27278 Transcript_11489/m.27278 type:complete len:82 (+) Transcript_11489:317-562(+)